MSSSSYCRLTVCAGAVVAVAAGLFCLVAPPTQLAMASRILLMTGAIGALVAPVVIGALFRRNPEHDDGDDGDQQDVAGPWEPEDSLDLELRQLLKEEGAVQ